MTKLVKFLLLGCSKISLIPRSPSIFGLVLELYCLCGAHFP